MSLMASQITSLTIVYSTVYSDADQRKHQSSASLAFVRGIHRGPVNSPHRWPVTRKMFPFDGVMSWYFNTVIISPAACLTPPSQWLKPMIQYIQSINETFIFRIPYVFSSEIWYIVRRVLNPGNSIFLNFNFLRKTIRLFDMIGVLCGCAMRSDCWLKSGCQLDCIA